MRGEYGEVRFASLGLVDDVPYIVIPHDAKIYRSRHKIENMFEWLKDWRRVATRYNRCPVIFMSAIALAATVLFWL